MAETIYLITYHKFNHGNHTQGKRPVDSRFLKSDKNYAFYLIDQTCPPLLEGKNIVIEKTIDPEIHEAGAAHFGEWSFLLSEAKNSFCQYPFFMISSRFYEKNGWLVTDLNKEWDRLFGYLSRFGWGFLPSYNRPLRWINYEWKHNFENEAWNHKFFPFTQETFRLVEELFQVRIPEDYHYCSDLYCNYIGFQSRQHLLDYVNFYKPLIDYFFDDRWNLKKEISPRYMRPTGSFKNERPFTFYLELLSHLFFFKNKIPFFCLHYNGYYEINESTVQMRQLLNIPVPLYKRITRGLGWRFRKSMTEGSLSPWRAQVVKRIPDPLKKMYRHGKFKLKTALIKTGLLKEFP
ncbi:MAG: hypothetical protein HYS22_08750 [Deltaproteobacteria bacterium]|nr:hypothetical protein [Deltaproteobacteria bacterium]